MIKSQNIKELWDNRNYKGEEELICAKIAPHGVKMSDCK